MGLANNKYYNIAWFQAVWWGMVYFQNQAIYAGLVFVVLHFILMKSDRLVELAFSLAVAALGLSLDTFFNYYGILDLYPNQPFEMYPPIWLGVLWLSFSCTLRFSLKAIVSKLYLSIPLGGLGGAGSYIAGAKLGIISYDLPFMNVAVFLTAAWACLFAIFSVISAQLDSMNGSLSSKKSVTRL